MKRRPCPIGGHQAPPGTAAPPWLAAARAVRAATDLLATHQHHHTGAWRTPDSHHLDDHPVRHHGLYQVAALTLEAAAAEPALRARARTGGLRWDEVTRPLPDLTAVRAAATTVMDSWNRHRTAAHAIPVDGRWLDRLTVVHPTDLAEDVNVLLARLRAVTWEILDSDLSTATLADLALAALAWHQLHGHGRAADTWRTVHTQLRSFSTLAPPDREVRSHVRAFVSASRLTPGRPADDIRETSAAFADVATNSVDALQRLQATGRLWISADTLTGQEVSDDPELAAAKLRHGIVPARPEHLHSLTVAYRTAVLALPMTTPA